MLKPKIRSDYRILLTKYATIGVFLIAGVSCSIAPIAADDKIWSWMVLSLYPLAVFLCLLFTRRDPSAALLFSILSAFIGVAYFLKFSLMLHYPDLVWGAGRVIDTSRVVENILPLMYALAPALFLYLVGLGIGPRLSVSPQEISCAAIFRCRVAYSERDWIATSHLGCPRIFVPRRNVGGSQCFAVRGNTP